MSASLRLLVERHVVGTGVAPGGSAAVAIRHEGGWLFDAGAAGASSAHNVSNVTTQTLYDLASITKSVTAVLAARTCCALGVGLDRELGEVLPETRGTASGSALLWQLLSHRAGLEAHIPIYEPLTRGQRVARSTWIAQAAEGRRSQCSGPLPAEGFEPLYSDLGFMLVGAALEELTGRPLDALVETALGETMDLALFSARTWFFRGKRPKDFAATETVAWRGGEILAAVHDENAFAIAGDACAGHAGLFGTAMDVARFGAALLDALSGDSALVDTNSLRFLLRRRAGGSLLAGFDGKSEVGSSAGERFSKDAFGHLGFTGTSYWCDPTSGTVVALLTNRVCPSREHTLIRAARPKIHTAMFDYAQTLTKAQ